MTIVIENNPFFRLPSPSPWQGRVDNDLKERFFQIINLYSEKNVPLLDFDEKTSALVSFCCDEGIRRNQGRQGAVEGPLALKESFANLPLHGQANKLKLIDMGDIVCPPNELENAQSALGEIVERLVSNKVFTIVLGGGHETAYGHYLGLRKKWEKTNLAIVNFDAHFDMRPLLQDQQGTSGTPFLQIANLRLKHKQLFHYYCVGINPYSNTQSLFEAAKEWQVHFMTCDQIHASQKNAHRFVEKVISNHDFIYVSVCLDVFSTSIAPGVSSPSPYGLLLWQVIPLIRQLAQSSKMVAFDIVELSPRFDRDSSTAKCAALCLAELLYSRSSDVL